MSADRLIAFATTGRAGRAEAALAARPELARDGWVALVLGRGWDGDPNEAGGPLGWAPLHYACHSCFGHARLARAARARCRPARRAVVRRCALSRRRGAGHRLPAPAARSARELDRRGEWSTPPEQYRTAYQNALVRNRRDLIEVLVGSAHRRTWHRPTWPSPPSGAELEPRFAGVAGPALAEWLDERA